MDFLEVPEIFPGAGINRHETVRKKVVAQMTDAEIKAVAEYAAGLR